MAYREPEPSVRVELRPSSFWLRLRIELRGIPFGGYAIWAVPAPVLLTIVVAWVCSEDLLVAGSFFVGTFLAFFVGRCIPTLLSAAARATVPARVELDLPRALVFRASCIRVEPADGEPYERRWPYFHEARRVVGGVELVLSRAPYLVFAVARSSVRRKDYEQLTAWLVDNKLLRAS
jgi:hypothetical protein